MSPAVDPSVELEDRRDRNEGYVELLALHCRLIHEAYTELEEFGPGAFMFGSSNN